MFGGLTMSYQIFTDSCSDLPLEVRKQYGVEYCHMNVVVDEKEILADLDWKLYTHEEFYGWMYQKKHMKTTQVPFEEFVKCFTPYLEKGVDILYISCSSRLSGSISIFELAKNELLEKFPGRKLIGVDSLCACAGEGLMTLDAAKLQKEGKSIEEVAEYVRANRNHYNQFATVDDLTYIKNAGRIKGSKAVLGNLFHKKPIFISDAIGNNYTLGTITGTKNADKLLLDAVVKRIDKEHDGKVVIVHAMAEDRAEKLKQNIMDTLNIEPEIWYLGPIIGTTCGPGTLAVFFYGEEVKIADGDGRPTPLDFSTLS